MTIDLSKKNIKDFFKQNGFLVSIFLLATMYTLRASFLNELPFVNKLLLIMRFTSYLLVAIKLVLDFFDKKYKGYEVFIAIATIYLVIVSKQSKTVNYLIYFIYVVVGKDIDYRKIIKIALIAITTSVVLIIFLSHVGVIKDKVFVEGSRNRHSLGFVYSPFLSTYCFYITLYYIYVRNKNINTLEILMLFAVNLYIFIMTDTKNAFWLAVLAILITFIVNNVRYIKSYNKFHTVVLLVLPVLLPIFVIVLSIIYNPDMVLFQKLNSLLSGRISLGQNAINSYGIKLFGRYIEFSNYWNYQTVKHNIIDSSYILYLMILGLVFFVLMILTLVYFARLIDKKKDIYMYYIFIIILLHSTFDAQLFQMSYNYFMFIWSYKNTEINYLMEK